MRMIIRLVWVSLVVHDMVIWGVNIMFLLMGNMMEWSVDIMILFMVVFMVIVLVIRHGFVVEVLDVMLRIGSITVLSREFRTIMLSDSTQAIVFIWRKHDIIRII